MIDLKELKQALGDNYNFGQNKTVETIKEILATGKNLDNDDVPCVLEAGNLDIEITIYCSESTHMPYLGYFCCICNDGEWESYKEIDEVVNLDVPDLQEEMLRVLADFAERESLSFFD